MPTRRRHLKVFLCHASADKPRVRVLYQRLIANGIDAWLDQEKLIPGQDWRLEIPKAVRDADVVVICLSNQSITKEGYVQKEIKFALDAAQEKPEGSIFIIPARLEECDVPEQLSHWQWVDLFSEVGYERLIKSLQSRAKAIKVSAVKIKVDTRFDESRPSSSPQNAMVDRRLDAAMPKECEVGQTTETRVVIALPNSEGLRAFLPDHTESGELIDKGDVRNAGTPIDFPYDQEKGQYLPAHLQVKIDAPGFKVGKPLQQILVPPNKDSGMLTFFLTPRTPQSIGRVSVKLYQDKECAIELGSVTLTTKVSPKQDERVPISWQLVILPLTLSSIQAGRVSPPQSGTPPDVQTDDTLGRTPAVRRRRRFPITIQAAVWGGIATIFAALITTLGLPLLQAINSTPIPPTPTPACITADDILVRLHIWKGSQQIATLVPSGRITLGPDETVDLRVNFESVSGQPVPTLECTWDNANTEDITSPTEGVLLHNAGCTVDYQSGHTKITDTLSLQVSQPACPDPLSYSFFILSP